MPRRLGHLLRPGLQRVGPFLLCCLLQAVSGQQQAAGNERLLSRSPWKRAGFPSAPAGPQAALSQADRAGGLKETHPDGREPKSGLGWPPRLPLSLPSCGAYPCTPPHIPPLLLPALPAPASPVASQMLGLAQQKRCRPHKKSLSISLSCRPQPSAETTPPFNFHQLFIAGRAALLPGLEPEAPTRPPQTCPGRGGGGCQLRPLQARGAAGAMASDNEATFSQGDGYSFPPLPQPQQLPLCGLLVTPSSSGTMGDR